MDTLDQIGLVGLVPVVSIQALSQALPAARALIQARLPVMEITLRTPAGLAAIRQVSAQHPDLLLGAGTVLNLAQCQAAVEAGARFIVSPGLNEGIVTWCQDQGVAVTPGCVTPTEIERALALGLRVVKFFPASVYGGIKACKALYEPYRSAGLTFIPTGGIDQDSLLAYIRHPSIHAVGGGWLCSAKDLADQRFDQISRTAGLAVQSILSFTLLAASRIPDLNQAVLDQLQSVFQLSAEDVQAARARPWPGNHQTRSGQLLIQTADLRRALGYLNRHGFQTRPCPKSVHQDQAQACFLEQTLAGIDIELRQAPEGVVS